MLTQIACHEKEKIWKEECTKMRWCRRERKKQKEWGRKSEVDRMRRVGGLGKFMELLAVMDCVLSAQSNSSNNIKRLRAQRGHLAQQPEDEVLWSSPHHTFFFSFFLTCAQRVLGSAFDWQAQRVLQLGLVYNFRLASTCPLNETKQRTLSLAMNHFRCSFKF